MPIAATRLLLIEDNSAHAFLIEEMLNEAVRMRFLVEQQKTLGGALACLAIQSYDVILADPGLPDSQGLNTFARLREAAPGTPIVALSAADDEELALHALQSGIQDYLSKAHLNGDALQRIVRYAIERQRSTQDLLESERRYRALIEQASDGIFTADHNGNLLDVNSEACAMLGYSRAELIGRIAGDVVQASGEESHSMAELRAGRTVRAERVMRRKDGSLLPAEISTRMLDDGRMQSIARDITERKQTERALLESEERFRVQYKASPIPAITWRKASAEFVLADFNDAALAYSGGRLSTQIGLTTDELTPVGSALRLELERCFQDQGMISKERDYTFANGETRSLLVNYVFVPPNMVTLHLLDLTERKRSDGERRAREAAEAANSAKSAYLSHMSHELRTPLNAILGFAQVLGMSDPTPDQSESIGYILSAGHHLLDLINEVLDLSRIEQGHLALNLEAVPVQAMLREMLDMIAPLAAQRNLTLHLADGAGCANAVLADPQRFRQVLFNLLANAVKYNNEGGNISLSCELSAAGTTPGGAGLSNEGATASEQSITESVLRILVTDSGPGIPAAKQHLLFTPFERLGAERSDVEGTGLGLALARLLIEAMDGTIGVDSVVGQGSTFWVELPLAAP